MNIGAPGRIRTSDRLVRSQVLYPTELRALFSVLSPHGIAGRAIIRTAGGEYQLFSR